MSTTAQTYTYIDPRTLEGDPFQVAAATFKQAGAAGELLIAAIKDAYVLARVAEMERQIQAGEEPDGQGFAHTPLGGRLLELGAQAIQLVGSIKSTGVAASYNPKRPPKELPA